LAFPSFKSIHIQTIVKIFLIGLITLFSALGLSASIEAMLIGSWTSESGKKTFNFQERGKGTMLLPNFPTSGSSKTTWINWEFMGKSKMLQYHMTKSEIVLRNGKKQKNRENWKKRYRYPVKQDGEDIIIAGTRYIRSEESP
jgi:hypothetical protein